MWTISYMILVVISNHIFNVVIVITITISVTVGIAHD